jgi:hypothetical protein
MEQALLEQIQRLPESVQTALIRPIKTETDYQDALERAGALMSSGACHFCDE